MSLFHCRKKIVSKFGMARNFNTGIALLFFIIAFTRAQDVGGKCGTFRYVERLHQKEKPGIDLVSVDREVLAKSELTSSGKFRVHYDTSGFNEPAMLDPQGNRIPGSYRNYIDTLKYFLDSVWRAEIDAFGFIPPPSDDTRGGGPEYDVYVVQFGGGTFGETVIEDFEVGPIKPNRQRTTYIRIENDFAGYRTKRDSAIAVTCAHEFHHAIQVGGSGLWDQKDFYFYEICAQAMEPTVFPHVKDYFLDLKPYYSQISTWSLFKLNTPGYERAIWGHFLIRRYGPGIMKQIWDEMKTKRPVSASQSALNTFSTSLEREFNEFSIWNFYTGIFADSTRYFPDAKLFPPLGISGTVTLASNEHLFDQSATSFTAHYFTVRSGNDSVFFSVTNTDFNDANTDAFVPFPFQLRVAPFQFDGSTKIYNDMHAKLTVSDATHWKYNSFIRTGVVPQKPMPAFPNPFNPFASSLFLSTEGLNPDNSTALSIYSASLDLVYSKPAQFTFFSGTLYAQWNGRDDKGNVVPSGIYVYVLSKGSQTIKGKFAVIR